MGLKELVDSVRAERKNRKVVQGDLFTPSRVCLPLYMLLRENTQNNKHVERPHDNLFFHVILASNDLSVTVFPEKVEACTAAPSRSAYCSTAVFLKGDLAYVECSRGRAGGGVGFKSTRSIVSGFGKQQAA